MKRVTTFRAVTVILFRHAYVVPQESPLEIQRVDENRLLDAREMESSSMIGTFRGFLARGDWGYYAYLDQRVRHRSWVQFGPRRVDLWQGFVPRELREQEALIHFCETSSAARGHGIYTAVLRRIVNDLKARSIQSIWISTTADNAASRRGIEKAGFLEHRRIALRVVFGWPFARILPASDDRIPESYDARTES